MHLPSWNVLIQVTIIGLLTGGVYALMATGLTLIFGVMRVINIAHGAFLIFSAYISYWLFTTFGLDPFLSVIVSVPVLFVIGIIFQRYILSRVKGDAGLGVLLDLCHGAHLRRGDGLSMGIDRAFGPHRLHQRSVGIEVYRPYSASSLGAHGGFVAAVLALAGVFLLLRYTNLGRAIRATIQNRSAAQLMGVNVERVQAMTFGIGLGTVAAGGALFSLIWTFNAGSHEEWISKMLSIIVLGGMGSLPGTFIAAIIMGVVESVAAVVMTAYLSPIVFYLILFITLIFRPQGC